MNHVAKITSSEFWKNNIVFVRIYYQKKMKQNAVIYYLYVEEHV